MDKKYKIIIATGIFPPEIGGPSFYAEMLNDIFLGGGHKVAVVTYGILKKLPTGLRHIAYAIRLIPHILNSDIIIALDTFSVAVPAVFLGRLFGKKVIIRVGGDFLWEEYTERTKERVLLSEFYLEKRNFSKKESLVFSLTRYVFKYTSAIIFSTLWQRDIFMKPYSLDKSRLYIIENVYLNREQRNIVPKDKILLSPSRDRFLKNKLILDKSFEVLKNRYLDITLDTQIYRKNELFGRLLQAYCLIVPSLSEVSPNIVLDSISLGVPVVITEDCGIKDRLGDIVVWVNSRDQESIVNGVETLMDAKIYSEYMSRMSKFSYNHLPMDIYDEFIHIFEKL